LLRVCFFFFFQAEDGIRDFHVTGVQTCALPIFRQEKRNTPQAALIYCRVSSTKQKLEGHGLDSQELRCRQYAAQHGYQVEAVFQIGRASCRERVWRSVGGWSVGRE